MVRFLLIWLYLGSTVFGQGFTLLDNPSTKEKAEKELVEESKIVAQVSTPEMILGITKAKEESEKNTSMQIDFSLMGKEVPGSSSDYFRLDTKSGTFLVVPSNGVDFRIDGFPYKQPLVTKEPEEKTEIVDSSLPKVEETKEAEELKTSSYQKAHAASMADKRPLITIAVKTGHEVETEIANGYMETLSALEANKYFHFAVIDSDNSNYKKLVYNSDKLQIVIWWHKDSRWFRRVYLGPVETYMVFEKIKNWSIEHKNNALLDFSSI